MINILMDVNKAILERRTIHMFESKTVSEEIILQAITAANQAPCHKLTFPWRFYSVSMEKRNEILNLVIELKSKLGSLDEKSKNIIRQKYLNPSHLLIASQIIHQDENTKREDYAACSCAIQNLSLSLTSHGVFTKWSTGSVTNNLKVYKILNLSPQKEEIIGFIWIGYGKNLSKIARPSIDKIYKLI